MQEKRLGYLERGHISVNAGDVLCIVQASFTLTSIEVENEIYLTLTGLACVTCSRAN
jgi:hypothetical protein